MKTTVTLVLALGLSASHLQAQHTDYTAKKIAVYKANAKNQVHFVPLEIGEIRPTGWLLDWAKDAAAGITGHLDEYEPVYGNGWKGFGFKARGADERDGTGWPIEQCSYWLDGGVKLGYILNDKRLIQKTSERLDLVVNGVLKGAPTFIYWKPDTIVNDGFNNWGHGIMGRALVSYYQATHNPKILQALEKVYTRYHMLEPSDRDMRSLDTALVRGATNVDAMTETFLATGNRTIIDSIIAYSNRSNVERLNRKLHSLKDRHEKGFESLHGVTFYETSRVPAIMSIWTGKQREMATTKNFISWGLRDNEMPYGLTSAQEWLSGAGSMHHIETCVVPASMWTYTWLMRITGQKGWGDRIENVFFNAGAGSIARDFKTMSYYQTPNRFSENLPEDPSIPGPGDQKFTPFGYEVLCCVGSCNWTIPNYVSNMWQATMDGGLAFALYGPCTLTKRMHGTDLKIVCNTDYPYGEKLNLTFNTSRRISMPLYFRLPSWCAKPAIKVNGKSVSINAIEGFARIDRTWSNGDKIELHLPMHVAVTQSRETPYPRTPYFNGGFGKATPAYKDSIAGQPYEYVNYGPLLFALPLYDADENHVIAGQKFNYALDIHPQRLASEVLVQRSPMPHRWRWNIDEAPIKLQVRAREIDWRPSITTPLPPRPVTGGAERSITLVPYCCAKFHVTMFPVTERTWTK